MLEVEAVQERGEDAGQVELIRVGVGVPQPHRFGLTVTGQALDAHLDDRAFDDR
jgi:hypothetical protein